ncbi:MAG: MurR/RpiR family transcriptional regulator [Spirochaetota bacterium]
MSNEHYPTLTLDLVRARRQGMPPALRRIADFVLDHADRAFKMSTTELARETGTKSESTVVRFYRALGFESYHEFKVTLAIDVGGSRVLHAVEDIDRDDTTATLIAKYFAGVEQTLRTNARVLDAARIDACVDLLGRARRVFLLGQAASSAVTLDAYHKLSLLGIDCHWSVDPHANAIALADAQPGDVVFCVSHSGESLDVVEPIGAARPTAKVIALTESPDSPLGRLADVVLPVITEEMNYRTDAVIARVVQTCIVGTLFLALLLRRGDAGEQRVARARRSLSHLKY